MTRKRHDFKPDFTEVTKLRLNRGISLMEAKRILVGRKLREVLSQPNGGLGDLRDVLAQVVNDLYPES